MQGNQVNKAAPATKRLDVLEASLCKKEADFDARLAAHIADVKSANGQPLNDKRNGASTMRRWEKQNEALRSKMESLEKTKDAIEREKSTIARVERATFPIAIQELIDNGTLTVWRKYPSYLFVKGVEKARIKYVKGKLLASYYNGLEKDQYAIFRDVFNELNKRIKAGGE